MYYLADDLYIGAKANFNDHRFIIIDADEYALRYMEKHNEQVMKVARPWLGTLGLLLFFGGTLRYSVEGCFFIQKFMFLVHNNCPYSIFRGYPSIGV